MQVLLLAMPDGWLPVIGEPIEIQGEPFMIHKTPYAFGWTVSCPYSGLAAGDSHTREGAIEIATATIAKHGIDKTRQLRAEAIKASEAKCGPRPAFFQGCL